jgi:hypothetical protein
MGFFMVVMSMSLLFLCYFSVKAYNRILELESSRMNRIFWLGFIIVQMIFILIWFNDDWLKSLVKFILNPTDTALQILIIFGFISIICLVILLALLKNANNDFKFIKSLFLVVWFMLVCMVLSVNFKEYSKFLSSVKIIQTNYMDKYQNIRCVEKCNILVIEKYEFLPWTGGNKNIKTEIVISSME